MKNRIPTPEIQTEPTFSEAEREAVYRAILTRRDTRGQFLPDPITDEVLSRVLMAAHYAPSVGFMQPWSFIIIRKQESKQRLCLIGKELAKGRGAVHRRRTAPRGISGGNGHRRLQWRTGNRVAL